MFLRPRFFFGLVRLARSLAATSAPLVVALVATACVAHRGYAPVGTGRVSARGGQPASAAPGSGALSPTVLVPDDLPDADLRIDYMIWLPRAMEVTWQVNCGEATASGDAGESLEAYRVRRLAELRAERERAQRQAAQVGSLIGGAVLGQQAAVVSTGGPAASAQAGVVVDGAAVGAAAGAATVSADVALAPDDVGAGYRKGSVELRAAPAGACRMEVAPRAPAPALGGATHGAGDGALAIDPALLTGTFQVSRRDDPARRRALVAARGAIELRGTLRTSLVAAGVDADVEAARARNRARLEAAAAARAARAQAELALRLELEARARVEAEARWHTVIHTRGEVIAYLGRCGADPHHRERIAEERRARAELELQLAARRQRLVLDLRGRLHATLVAAGADPALRVRLAAEAEARARAGAEARARAAQARADYEAALAAEAVRRAEASAQVRAEVSAALIAGGARRRPPMPPPIDENPGLPPASGATWVAGHWVWSGLAWEWSAGGWLGGATILPGVTVVVGGSAGSPPMPLSLPAPRPLPPPGYQPPPPPPSPTSYAPPPAPSRDQVRDHRNGEATVTPPAPPPPPPAPAPMPRRPKVRDHRDGT